MYIMNNLYRYNAEVNGVLIKESKSVADKFDIEEEEARELSKYYSILCLQELLNKAQQLKEVVTNDK